MDKKYDKYLEGNYDNDNKEKQEKADKLQAERIGKLVDNMRREQTEDLINSVLGDEELPIGDEEAVRELLHEYVSNKDEYLVDGAVLTCSMASTGTYLIGNVGLGTEIKNIDNPTQTLLRVSSNLSEINGMPVATVKDHKKQMNTGNIEQEETGNIEPFKCNCLSFPDRESEREAILNDEECKKYGICRQLMKLDNDWENFIRSTGYLSFNRTTEKERVQGITMKSVLFCSHGGLITPVTSGQINTKIVYALACATTGGPIGELEWEQMKANAEYIYNYFDSKGWTAEAICGLLGNIFEECKLNPGAWQHWNDVDEGYGLVQWTPAEDYIVSFAKLSTDSVNALAQNNPLELMNSELQFLEDSFNGRWLVGKPAQEQYAKLSLSPEIRDDMTYEEFSRSDYKVRDMTLIFQACYERSNDDAVALEERIIAAELWYDYLVGGNREISRDDFAS